MMFMSQNSSIPTNTLAVTISKGLLHYLKQYGQSLPARIQLALLSLVENGWLETGLDKLFYFITWLVVIMVLAIM